MVDSEVTMSTEGPVSLLHAELYQPGLPAGRAGGFPDIQWFRPYGTGRSPIQGKRRVHPEAMWALVANTRARNDMCRTSSSS